LEDIKEEDFPKTREEAEEVYKQTLTEEEWEDMGKNFEESWKKGYKEMYPQFDIEELFKIEFGETTPKQLAQQYVDELAPDLAIMKNATQMSVGNRLKREMEEDIFNGWGNLTHVGDITYWNGSVYCPCTDWGGASRTLGYIMVYSSADLSFVTSYDIGTGTIPNSTDLSGIAYIYDPNEDTNDFWILGGDALRIYKYNEAFSYQTRYYDLPYSGWDWYDGICFNRENGRLYGNTGSLLIEFSAIPPTNMEDAHDILAIRTQVIVRPPSMYYEGIAIDPDEKHMYIVQKHSAGDDPLGLFYYFP